MYFYSLGTLNDTQETQRSSRSVNTNREQSLPRNSQEYRDQLLMSMSSVGGESLQEIWKMLDERPSPSPYATPRYPGRLYSILYSKLQKPLLYRIITRFTCMMK